jgi:fructose-bisphosphate aldolase class 1
LRENLHRIANALVAPGKGVPAADDSVEKLVSHFVEHEIPPNPSSRRDYGELLFTAPGLDEYVSGVIMHEDIIERAESVAARGIVACGGLLHHGQLDRDRGSGGVSRTRLRSRPRVKETTWPR